MSPQELRHAGIKNHFLQTLGLEKGTEMFARFLKSATNFTSSGFATTPPEILATREATCRACDQWDAAALNATGRCRKCGCSTWAKLRMATESCPLGKWKAVSSPSVSPVSSVVNPLPPAPEATRKPA